MILEILSEKTYDLKIEVSNENYLNAMKEVIEADSIEKHAEAISNNPDYITITKHAVFYQKELNTFARIEENVNGGHINQAVIKHALHNLFKSN